MTEPLQTLQEFTMRLKEPQYDVGVIVGRFQVHELHAAHRALIQNVIDRHPRVIVFLGLSPLLGSLRNPLDFEARKQMILEAFPEVTVQYIKDDRSDEKWSQKLDEQVYDLTRPNNSVVLYGGRDSFINHYQGKYPTSELVQDHYISGTESRRTISKKVKGTADFRAGVIWATANQYPKCLATVDVAIMNGDQILLGRKPREDQFRLIGGFSEPKTLTYEGDVQREVMEETGISIGEPQYLGSHIINDWRYQREADKIKTLLFRAEYQHGALRAGDDIAEVRWFSLNPLDKLLRQVVPEHQRLLSMLPPTPDTDKETGNEEQPHTVHGQL